MSGGALFSVLRSHIAGWLFRFAGKLDASYDVWLDEAPSRRDGDHAMRWCGGCGKDTLHQRSSAGDWWCLNG